MWAVSPKFSELVVCCPVKCQVLPVLNCASTSPFLASQATFEINRNVLSERLLLLTKMSPACRIGYRSSQYDCTAASLWN